MAKKNNNQTKSVKEDEGEILDDVLSDEEPKVVDKEDDKETEEKEEVKDAKEEGEDKVEEEEEEKKEVDKKEESVPEPIAKEDNAPPPKPKRPLTPRQEALKSLQEAFPTLEAKYVQSHLIASDYKLEPAFNALLYLSDPENFNLDEVVPESVASANIHSSVQGAPEPVPALPQRRRTQLEEDELLAKRLDEEYKRKERRRARRQEEMRRQRREGYEGEMAQESDEDVFTNFVEKDLPQIKEQFTKNIEETKNKFNSWVSGWKNQYSTTQQELNNRQFKQQINNEFDDEPEEVDLQKFHGIKLNDETSEVENTPKLPNRNRAGSTDLYGTPKSNKTNEKTESKSTKASLAEDDDEFLLSD